VKNYYSTLKTIFFIIVGLHFSLYFFGILRPSVIYDYVDYWPVTLIPLFLILVPRTRLISEAIKFYSYALLISIGILFLLGHLMSAPFLGTYSTDYSFENLELKNEETYKVIINEDNSIILESFEGSGYKIDIIDKPGDSGYPEAIETLVGNPLGVIFRGVNTSPLLKVKGWEIQLGTSNSWELDIFSIDSDLDLNNLEITKANLSGTGTINLGENLRLEKLLINGVYEVNVSKNLPIVVSGNAETPSSWINASIGTLNNVNESYRLLVEIVDGSEVIFNDE
jgi:hypothetical protein|tara:strand:- start:2008 stop:2853 length:846 start_codon:yes stop_codon:yes gene_type:complete